MDVAISEQFYERNGDVNLANLKNVARMRDLWSVKMTLLKMQNELTKFYELMNEILLYHRLDQKILSDKGLLLKILSDCMIMHTFQKV